MEILPAIDLRNGHCVRLTQGDYDRETVFDDDPVGVAKRWLDQGARRLHVVDLDGARDGVRGNADAVAAIVQAVDIPIQLGGGVRDAAEAHRLIDIGVDRVIIGTAAIEAPDEVRAVVDDIGTEHVIVGIDAKDGMVQTRGWHETSKVTAIDLASQMVEIGVRRFIYTDTSRDGTLTHPNFDAVAELSDNLRYPIIVAGGIASIDDLVGLAKMGVESAISGMAIYSGALDLKCAIETIDEMTTAGK
ncbi:MAG: 1-(5-phosphoribosyl)-5-[(5-phosphoribosylamino)methylideneamino]imidazole-4-carboxamide isomerase [Dehalococcoidia bacterium]|jgi:phosphoribosylformimino-5-aminoimidazole carboxamide ribotide isomerase|nr:1-(5-phosphoribosyl)-5-[(5-phosphoribosylamino)methylideneamino]imidazole-4-carboxamide isomerase [Chloroflexota bacterium]MDP6055718.1 1-(5-phosphoribosyl)-5-[(5-phosphoribosylamino)methylideneamino]imidazole-4-carboxamide isomerase [Dehalococcoidia bacterium]MDP7090179.1 1-(5-phosphoribosyl)-5-[(5-phosphoribosylamino)methylideneamino]imidazole-4-carboxamide isomerase [Dehalococcoidia bacterium]MDP7262074.1 1-(5-phosphoribosyl)-5-[(5-phosphoribosylamino)methylideneamino]imidazole-4-carboxami|tara:strand:+ start:2511 stop:3248 length:738 start_codon:yes stop_codon:yes gene_type:complete